MMTNETRTNAQHAHGEAAITNTQPEVVEWPRLLDLRDLQPPGAPDIVAELIGAFLNDSTRRMATLQEAAAEGRWRDVGHQAHTLKGSAALLACEPLRVAAEIVETAVRTGATDILPEAIVVLADALALARDVLASGPPIDA